MCDYYQEGSDRIADNFLTIRCQLRSYVTSATRSGYAWRLASEAVRQELRSAAGDLSELRDVASVKPEMLLTVQ